MTPCNKKMCNQRERKTWRKNMKIRNCFCKYCTQLRITRLGKYPIDPKAYLGRCNSLLKFLLQEYECKGNEDVLKFVYKKFPPKDKKKKLNLPNPVSHEKMKKCLQKAVCHYHPDNVDGEKHGKKWKVLSEEICKVLTQRYEQMKWRWFQIKRVDSSYSLREKVHGTRVFNL